MDNTREINQNPACKCAPNLYLAANFLEPDDKYRAFLAARSAMKSVDGMANGHRAAGKLTRRVRMQIMAKLDRFTGMFLQRKFDNSLPHSQDLRLAIARFEIPHWPFTKMAEAMKFNLENDRFDNLDRLTAYLQEITLPPAAVFFHLAGCSFDEAGQLSLPSFDIESAARPMAAFCSLTHVLTDFKADFASETKPTVYFDLETTEQFHVGEDDLAEAVASGRQSLKLTKMIMWYYNRLTAWRTEAEAMLEGLAGELPVDGLFTLNFIFEIYRRLADKISERRYIIVEGEFDLSPDDIEKAALAAAGRTDLSSEEIVGRLGVLLSPQKPNVTY